MNESDVRIGLSCVLIDTRGEEHIVKIDSGEIIRAGYSEPHCRVRFAESERIEMVPLHRLIPRESDD